MGGTHKKKLRAEKAKVKLKGAKLPKGLNVTKTEFKVRKIAIRDQLKEHQYVEGQRQFNLKETLSRLKHHSSNFRQDAMRNLREGIITGQANLSGHMSELLQSIVANCLEMDRETRRDCFKTLNALMGTLSEQSVAPFFHIISSYLRCAMTHIQPALQEDSLMLLDVLLQHVPQLVATHSSKIFQNFLEMISKVRSEGEHTGRMLTVHMGQKQTTVKWRTKVLERLQQMFATLAAYKKKTVETQQSGGGQCLQRTYNVKTPQFYSLKRPYVINGSYEVATIWGRSGSKDTAVAPTGGVSVDEALLLRSYVEHLMPLLLEAWLEVRPQEQSGQILLSNDAARTLKVILEIIQNLWCLIEMHERLTKTQDLSEWFKEEQAEVFAVNFIGNNAFPYQQAEQIESTDQPKRAKKAKVTLTPGEQYCVPQNICLAYLMCRFHGKPALLKQQSSKFGALLKYLHTITDDLNAYSALDYRHLPLALRAYLLQHAAQLSTLQTAAMSVLLRSTIRAFLHNEFPHKEGLAAEVLVLLCEVAQTPQLLQAYGESEFVAFLQYLPQLLLKSGISSTALVAMNNLGKQKNTVFLQALSEQLLPVIENVQKIQVFGAANAFEGKKHIMNLFYWTEKGVDEEQKKLWADKIDEHVTDKRIVSYFKYVLSA